MNIGEYIFVDGKLSASFTTDCYIFVKSTDNAKWLLAMDYCTETTCTFVEGGTEKMFIPGGMDLTFTLTENEDGSVTVSYAKAEGCVHNYVGKVTTEPGCVLEGTTTYTCSKCGAVYTESIPATGHTYEDTVVPPTCENNGYTVHTCTICGYHHSTDAVNPIGHDYISDVIAPTCTQTGYTLYTCLNCGNSYEWNSTAALGHTFVNGVCSTCGEADPDYVPTELDYYLFGYINGADYGIGDDQANLGEYKFVDGKLTVKFDETSYVAVKASDNATFYMTNGWVGEATSATLYAFTDPNSTSANKLLVSGGQTVTFTLTENWDGNLLISYTVDSQDCVHSSHNTDGICSTCGAAVEHTYSLGVCTVCGAQDPDYSGYVYYLFG
jgi:DNA-directed RNA polymerase subunit RPC12/RpoP